ncbi:molybdenum cofactor guanylyltransferase [Thalassotalea sp. M1531]|uniref:Molybdenum cofactor guanylyltransferase n=1 Tax=Thalassotalea algicola TaxID=2716224 RepID=A0A7Y0LCN9_9GAMM|nr:molybdenum cofactor guanylyltransferase [Thalassotalea algicola]NMP32139.1 molybdenum cofactor guanylyltransferase [Thalassotalea algicola]
MAAVNHGCIGIVLAGGLSSRMGSDKAQLMRDNKSMLDFSTQLLNEVGVDRVVVSGNNYHVPDIFPQQGPVGGIYSVFNQVPCQAALIIPIDLPLMDTETLTSLKQAGQVLSKAVHFDDHSLPLYLPNNAFTELFFEQKIQVHLNSTGKGPSIKAMLKQVPHQTIKCRKASALTNTNTPNQWQQVQSQIFMPTRSN